METRETGKLIRAHNNGLNYVTEPFSGIGVSLTHTTAAEYLKSIFDVPMQRESENLSLLSPGIYFTAASGSRCLKLLKGFLPDPLNPLHFYCSKVKFEHVNIYPK
ncbi:hypothetical protein ACO22_04463 [Paracoccidioides brasiliensis]|uniref:Uncharacterized protein n=1 Tax=Paracoccidioides brasiliensis TaxID=121759 RepID=A0A1D2JD03_PARBR|nr:hypothetical protein ACO22_04463 [Paracoccidioides brasiliensis]